MKRRSACFRELAMGVLGVLLGMFCVGVAGARELVEGGDMGNLDAIGIMQRIPAGATREMADENSSFKEVFPDNGKSLKVGTDGPIFVKMLELPLVGATGKLKWSFDFKSLDVLNENGKINTGIAVALMSGKEYVARVVFGEGMALHGPRKTKEPRTWEIKKEALSKGVWYHFVCEVDLTNRLLRGSVTSEMGDQFDFEEAELPPSESGEPFVECDTFQVRTANGTNNIALPALLDNLSLQTEEEAR